MTTNHQQYWYANLSEHEKKARRPYVYFELFRGLLDEGTYTGLANAGPEAGRIVCRRLFDQMMSDTMHCLRTLNLKTAAAAPVQDDLDPVSSHSTILPPVLE